MTGVIYSQIFLTDAYAEDPTVKALVDSYNDEVAASLEKVVGYSAQNLEWSTQLVRGQNSPSPTSSPTPLASTSSPSMSRTSAS